MKVTVPIHYSEEWINIKLPEEQILAIIDPKDCQGVSDEAAEIKKAIENPISGKFFSTFQELEKKQTKNSVIICDDYTRPTPVKKILPILLEKLSYFGIENPKIIIGSGTHRAMTQEEIEMKVGKDITNTMEVISHHWEDKKELVELGETHSGVPIIVNKHVIKSSIKIGIGNIIPHSITGWSGGAKIIQPGVCGCETTGYTHWLSARYPNEEIIGIVENPVRHEIEQVTSRIGLDFIVNTILNKQNKIVKVVSGDFIRAHREGVKISESIYKVEVPSKADVVICDSYPCDVNMWQAVKAIFAASLVVKEGGVIVLVTPCWEGVSNEHPEILKIGYRPYNEVKTLLDRGEVNDLCALSDIARVGNIIAEKARVILFSDGISEEETKKLNFDFAKTPQDAVEKAIACQGSRPKILVLRSASELLPHICTGRNN